MWGLVMGMGMSFVCRGGFGHGQHQLFAGLILLAPYLTRAVIAQLVARRSHNPKVVSSILTRRIRTHIDVAGVECRQCAWAHKH